MGDISAQKIHNQWFLFTDWCEVNISDEQKKFVINLEKCRQKVINVKGN